MKNIVVALAGNPNAGKSTIFNHLTGSRQHVGNYPGVTVEKKSGIVESGGRRFTIIDLPGAYSLSAASPEEVVTRDYLIREKPDVVINVLDASNIERNLYLATQLIELGCNLVFALNMYDMAKAGGVEFDLAQLSRLLGAPVIPTIGNKGGGLDVLLAKAAEAADKTETPPGEYKPTIAFDPAVESAIDELCALIGQEKAEVAGYSSRWLAARLLEADADITSRIGSGSVKEKAETLRKALREHLGESPEISMAESRYGWISGLCGEAVRSTVISRHDVSDRIDGVLLHRMFGIPIFLALMYLLFYFVFTLAEPPMEWLEAGFSALGDFIAQFWPKASDSPLRSLLVDGIVSGVGGVLVFLPNIILLFLAIAFLEGTGYMARAAFLMDSLMHRMGLHGKSFIPLLLGFGCTVPAIMATRTLETRRDRLLTIFVLPFMSCGARLPIYVLLIPAFFPEAWRARVLWLVYFIGIVAAVAGARILGAFVFKGESVPFVMELPPYRMPTFRSVFILMWERSSEYCKKAGTVILAASIILWAMSAYPKKETFSRNYNALTQAAHDDFLRTVERLAPPGQGKLLVEWTEATLDLEAAENEFWESDEGMKTAEKDYEAKSKELFKTIQGGHELATFVEALRSLDAAGDADERGRLAVMFALQGQEGMEIFSGIVKYRAAREIYHAGLAKLEREERAESMASSVLGRLGGWMEPVLKPLGFDWRVGTALLGALAAKEVFVAQLSIIFATGDSETTPDILRDRLRENYRPLQGFCMMLFCLLSAPCIATIAITRREAGGWKYALGMLAGLTIVAYVVTLVVYQLGSLLGL